MRLVRGWCEVVGVRLLWGCCEVVVGLLWGLLWGCCGYCEVDGVDVGLIESVALVNGWAQTE